MKEEGEKKKGVSYSIIQRMGKGGRGGREERERRKGR